MKPNGDYKNSVSQADLQVVYCFACREPIFAIEELLHPLTGDQFMPYSDGWNSPPPSPDRNDMLCPLCGWVFLTPNDGVVVERDGLRMTIMPETVIRRDELIEDNVVVSPLIPNEPVEEAVSPHKDKMAWARSFRKKK